MPKYFYDCPVIAAYMAKYQRIDFGAAIHWVFDILCTTNQALAVNGTKFYLKDSNSPELRPQPDDIVVDAEELIGRYRGLPMSGELRVIYRNGMPFFMPKVEDQNA